MTREERWLAIEAAARALLQAIDRNLEERPWPWKYAVPWKEATALRDAINTAFQTELMRRIPPGPR
jgi:hypothetical protein